MDVKVLQALANPLRVALLDALARETASRSDLSLASGIDLSNVSYHVTVLRKAGLIEEVEARESRGSIERFYRSSVQEPLRWLPTTLDSHGRREVDRAVEESMAAVRLADERSTLRLSTAKGNGAPLTVVLASFETPNLGESAETSA